MSTAHDDTPNQEPLPAAKAPVGPGAITYVGVLLALVVVILGATGLQTSAAAAGLTTSRPWLSRAADGVQGLRPLGWAVPVAVVMLLVGLWLVIAGLLPRPQSGLALNAATGVFLRPRDLAQLAHDAADDIDGVTSVHATASRREVSLTVQTTGDKSVREAVQQAVTLRLAPLRKRPRVNVRTKQVAL